MRRTGRVELYQHLSDIVDDARVLALSAHMGALWLTVWRKHESWNTGNNKKKRCHTKDCNQFWVTDITYIPIPGKMLYMCAVLDLCGKVVLAWKIGTDMCSSLVTDTIREALQREKVTGGLALHSDQGSQYTSQAYFDLTQAYHVSPSMSSPGCPYDKAAMENFFGTLKTECLYRAHFTTRAEVGQLVTEYVDFYNFDRISLKNGLTPVEIRSKTA